MHVTCIHVYHNHMCTSLQQTCSLGNDNDVSRKWLTVLIVILLKQMDISSNFKTDFK